MSEGGAIWRDPEFIKGARDMRGVVLGIAAWGLVTGVAMVKGGFGVWPSLLMSLVVYAGSAQLAALPLMAAGAPLWLVCATAFCVNLRFIIFSAQWRPYLAHLPLGQRLRMAYFSADLNYILFMRRFPEPQPSPEQLPYFWGGVAAIWLAWQLPNLVGIVFAEAIPTAWGIGFAGTLALLGFTYSMLGDRSTWASAAVAGCAAVAAYALPLRLNIALAIACAVAVGLLMDRHAGRGRRMIETLLTIVCLGGVSLLTRAFFLIPQREFALPAWLRQGLRHAPLAALAAVVVPEVLMDQGRLLATWQDARLGAAAAATLVYFWCRDILWTIVGGTVVMVALRVGLGW